MAYSELLADRVRSILDEKGVGYEDKKMFGGICFMVDHKMCVGIVKEELMARVGPGQYEKALSKNGARPMDFTDRPMKGFVFVSPEGVDTDRDLEKWVEMCLAYNPEASSSKKK